MKKILPTSQRFSLNSSSKTSNTTRGFTLIELLVAISIIAVLAVIGLTFFTTAQKNARDARRRSDIDSVSKALETNKVPGTTTYSALADSQFASGKVPTDSGNNVATYCAASTITPGGSPPARPTTWDNTLACPAGYATIAGGASPIPAAGTTAWTICALLENAGTEPIYCRTNTQ